MSTATQNVPAPYGEPFTNLETRNSQTKAGAQPFNVDGETQRPQGTTATGAHEAEAAKRESESSQAEPTPDRGTNKHSLASSEGEQPAEEEGGAAKGEGQGEKPDPSDVAPEGGYPEQLHAGKVDGVGPEYGKQNRTGFAERVQGVKEQIKGTIKRDPELKQKGHERMTGELKKKQHEEQESDPFDPSDGKANDKDKEGDKEEKKTAEGIKGEPTQREAGTDTAPHAHPTDKGAHEQAENVKPEGQEQGMSEREKRAKEGGESAQVGSGQ